MEHIHTYLEGDWIVHLHYGLGQIKGYDVKDISGEKTRYCRVETADSTFWIPVDLMDSEIIRRLSTPEEIQEAIATLERPPRKMSSNFKMRQSRIQHTRTSNTPKATAQLLRDLQERQRDKGPLNQTERGAFRSFKKRLIEEWAAVTGVNTESVLSRLNLLLNPARSREANQVTTKLPQEEIVTHSPSPSRNQKHWTTWGRQSKETKI